MFAVLLPTLLCAMVLIAGTCTDEISAVCVTTDNATDVTADSATLWGVASDFDHNDYANVWFTVVSSNSSRIDTTYQTLAKPGGPFSYTITELQPDTEYSFTAYALGTLAHTKLGSGHTLTFHTLAGGGGAPSITTGDVDIDVPSGTAVLHGTIESMGAALYLLVDFDVKETSAATPAENMYQVGGQIYSAGPFSIGISVTPGSTYSYMAEGSAPEGYSGYFHGEERTFTVPTS